MNNILSSFCTYSIDTKLEAMEADIKTTEHSRLHLKVKARHHGKPTWHLNDELLPADSQSKHFHYAKARHFGLHYGSGNIIMVFCGSIFSQILNTRWTTQT